MEIEQDQSDLLRLCWLVEQQRKAERLYSRAKWALSYYKKAKALPKKIEEQRLKVLDKQKNLLDVKKKLQPKISIVRDKLKAKLLSEDGVIILLRYPINPKHTSLIADWRELNEQQIAEMSDQYEAEKILNKILIKGNGHATKV